jgi:hypothetical protein
MRSRDELILENIYSEGIVDRFKANRAGKQAERDAGVKFGDKLRGKAVKTIAGDDILSGSKLQKKLDAGTSARDAARINILAKSYMKKLKDIVSGFQDDIAKFNIDVSMIDNDEARKILSLIIKYDLAQDIPVKEIGSPEVAQMSIPKQAPKISEPVTRKGVRDEQESIKTKKRVEAAAARRQRGFDAAKSKNKANPKSKAV